MLFLLFCLRSSYSISPNELEAEYIQVVDNRGEKVFMDDCRCELARVYLRTENENSYISFEYCDTVYARGSYKIISWKKSQYVDTLFVKSSESRKLDTILIYKEDYQNWLRIWRSNTDGNTQGHYFVPSSDRLRYKYLRLNCDDDQG